MYREIYGNNTAAIHRDFTFYSDDASQVGLYPGQVFQSGTKYTRDPLKKHVITPKYAVRGTPS